jgi:hypothetical protein
VGWSQTSVAGPVGREPSDRPAPRPGDGPSVLVDQPVMERAQEDQVVQIGAASTLPPDDVVGLGESARPAPREPTLGVAVPQLAKHPRRRLPGHPPDTNRVAHPFLDHRLNPTRTQEAPGRLGVDQPTTFELTARFPGDERLERCMDHHRGPVGIGVAGQGGGGQCHERIGLSSICVTHVLSPRHHRELVGGMLECPGHRRSFGRRELSLQAEPPFHRRNTTTRGTGWPARPARLRWPAGR